MGVPQATAPSQEYLTEDEEVPQAQPLPWSAPQLTTNSIFSTIQVPNSSQNSSTICVPTPVNYQRSVAIQIPINQQPRLSIERTHPYSRIQRTESKSTERMAQIFSDSIMKMNQQSIGHLETSFEKMAAMMHQHSVVSEERILVMSKEREEMARQAVKAEAELKVAELERQLMEERHKTERASWERERRAEHLQTENAELVAKCARLSEGNAVPPAAVRALAVTASNLSEPVAEAVQPERETSIVQSSSGSASIEACPLLTTASVSVPVQQITISEEQILEIMQMKKIPRNSLAEKVFRLDLNMDEFTQFLRATGKCAETLQIYDKKRGLLNFFSYKGDRLDPVKFNAFTDSIGGGKAFRINQYHEAFANQTRYVAILPNKVVSERDMMDVLKAWSSCQPIFKCDPVKFGRIANEGTNAHTEAINQLNNAFAANKVYMWSIFDNLGSSNGASGSG